MLMSEDELTKLNQELLSATAEGNLNKVKELLNKGADVNTQDSMGNTPLHLVVKAMCRDIKERAEYLKNIKKERE